MFLVGRLVPPQQQAQDVPVALPAIFCKVVLQLSARPQALLIGRSPRVRQSALVLQSASALRPPLRALAA